MRDLASVRFLMVFVAAGAASSALAQQRSPALDPVSRPVATAAPAEATETRGSLAVRRAREERAARAESRERDTLRESLRQLELGMAKLKLLARANAEDARRRGQSAGRRIKAWINSHEPGTTPAPGRDAAEWPTPAKAGAAH
jgi:hypothetical protein